MKTSALLATALTAHLFTGTLHAQQVPQLVNYQGRVAVGNVNFNGSGSFKFALVNGAGTTMYWSNDGTSTSGLEPINAVALLVNNGLYSVLLGDTSLANMTAIPAGVWSNGDVRLRVWFNDGTNGSQLLTPDQRIAPQGYLSDGAVTASKLSGTIGLWTAQGADVLRLSGRVGIGPGASFPFTTLTVDGTIGFPTVASPMLYIYPSGTANAQKPVIVHSPGFPGYGLFYDDSGDRFSMKSSPADTSPSLVVDVDSNWVAIAIDQPKPGYELSVNGEIVCENLLIEDSADWPDYVFAPEYPLRPLDEVEAHIQDHGHLPGIPSAAEVGENGLSVGTMQRQMMEKIEELTLYIIEQNKRLAAQEQQIAGLEETVQRMQKGRPRKR